MDTTIPQINTEKPTRVIVLALTVLAFILIATLFIYRYSKSALSTDSASVSKAQAYYNIDYSGDKPLFGPSRQRYIPVIYKSYNPVEETPSQNIYYYYSSESTSSTSDSYDYSGGYVPAGCEGGTDYSTVDGQPCG